METQELFEYGGIGVLALMTLIQIAPIKLDPWSYLFRCLGKAINKDIEARLDALDREVKSLKEDVRVVDERGCERDIQDARIRILRFGDEILHGIPHSKEHFEQILMDIDNYHKWCGGHPNFKNGITDITTQRVREVYKERLDKGGFL